MDPAYLLSDEAFSRRIALGLLRDRGHADDLVQEAWLEVLEKGPKAVASPRGYLASLLGMLAFKKRRGEARRAARERAGARAEAQPDTAGLVARAEIHARTVAAVLALDEPYRSTILLRFFEDQTPAEIAARAGIQVETVRTRLKRALALLRARLERDGRDWREEWLVALTGSGHWPEAKPTPLRHLGSAASVAAVVLVAWFAWPEPPRSASGTTEVAGAGVVDVGDGLRRSELTPPATNARAALAPASAPAPAGWFLTGRVRDQMGRPLAEVRVLVAISRFGRGSELSNAITDESGSFACPLAGWNELSPTARGLLGLVIQAWKSGHEPLVADVELESDGQPEEQDLVLAPGRLLSGRVLGPTGEPVVDAFVRVFTSGGQRVRTHEIDAPTNRDGWFWCGLEAGEGVAGLFAYGAAHGFAHRAGEALAACTSGDIALDPLVLTRGSTLRGRCVHPDGTPAARLTLQVREVELDPSGGFRPCKRQLSELAGGRGNMDVVTDEFGRFEAVGLRDGLFQLLDGVVPLGETAWRSDGADITLVVERRRVLLEVTDPSGRPLEEARIVVTRLSSTEEPVGTAFPTITTGNPPLAPLKIAAGETLAILVLAPGCAALEERFVVPDGVHDPRLRIELRAEERGASLALIPSSGPPGAWRIGLSAPYSLVPLPGLQVLCADEEGRVHGLPLGRYGVRVEPRDSGTSAAALARREPLLLSQGEVSLAFSVLPAARLRILFTGAGTDTAKPPEPIDKEGWVTSADRLGWMTLFIMGRQGVLELRHLDGEAGQLLARVTGLRPKAGQFLDLAVPALPALLHLSFPGREPFQRELFPMPGETLEIPYALVETPRSKPLANGDR